MKLFSLSLSLHVSVTTVSFFSICPVCKNTLYMETDSLSSEIFRTMWISRTAKEVHWVRWSKCWGACEWNHVACCHLIAQCTIINWWFSRITYFEKSTSCNLILVIRECGSLGISVRPHPHPKRGSVYNNIQSGMKLYLSHWSWLRLMVDFKRLFFLSALALSCIDAAGSVQNFM